MSTVNINIKNCNCSSGTGSDSGGSASDDQGYDNEPSTGGTPPRGFSQSAITGRPCKVAVWAYDWVDSWLNVIGDNAWFVSMLIQVALSSYAKTFMRVLQGAIGSLLGLVIGVLDIVPGDEIPMAAISGGLAMALLETGVNFTADKLTEAMITDSVTKFQANRGTFICLIAKGQNAAESKKNVEAHLVSEGYPGPIQWMINSLMNDFYNVVFYTPDWWPGFDDYLTGITEVCCDGLTDGKLIEPGSAQACRGANFVLDGLVAVLTSADMYVQNYSRTAYNSLSGTEAAMLANVQANYLVPVSITGKAWSWQLSQAELARYMYAKLSGSSWLVPGGGVTSWELGRLGAHLQSAVAICELRDSETAQAAYELLAGEIDAWLSANVTDQGLLNHIRLFCQGLIHPEGAFIGVLFAESADLAGFEGSSDCSECVISYSYLAQGTCPALTVYPRAIPVDGEWRIFYAENMGGWWGLAVNDNFIGDATPQARWNVKMEFGNISGYTVWRPDLNCLRVGNSDVLWCNLYAGNSLTSFQDVTNNACCGTIGFTSSTSFSVEMRLIECQLS